MHMYSGNKMVNPHADGKQLCQIEYSAYAQILLPWDCVIDSDHFQS